MSESFRLGAVLALIGGFLDAHTYLTRGGVLANAQTGNIVSLGVRPTERDWGGVSHYLVPILALTAGVLAAELTRGRFRGTQALHWRQITVAVELLLPAAVASLPAASDNAANVLVVFVCAVQVESSCKVNGNAFTITMCIGNLRSSAERLYLWGRTGEWDHGHRVAQYYGIIAFPIIGAALGAWCSGRWGQRTVLGACVLLLAAFSLIFQRKPLVRVDKGV